MPDLPIDTVVCGDALEFLRGLPDGCADAVIADPPYGTGGWSRGHPDRHRPSVYTREAWDEWGLEWLTEAKRIAPAVVTFCPQSQLPDAWTALPGARLLAWIKPDPNRMFMADGRVIYGMEPILALGRLHCVGALDYCVASSQKFGRNKDATPHPHEKPLRVMRWLVEMACPEGGLVIDPYCGSGSTLVAAQTTGRHYLGCDLSPEYVALAQDRLRGVRSRAGGQSQLDLVTA